MVFDDREKLLGDSAGPGFEVEHAVGAHFVERAGVGAEVRQG